LWQGCFSSVVLFSSTNYYQHWNFLIFLPTDFQGMNIMFMVGVAVVERG
jgi:hypothetical protein